jgi:excisionase family DNA binding protein
VAFERTRIVKRSTIASCPICLSSDGLVTSAQAAALLQVGEPSIRRWLSQGKAHGFKTPGGQYRICRKSLFDDGSR